jgi:hypothetical protein
VGRCDPKLDLGATGGSERPKNQSAHNLFKMDVCIGLFDKNPTQLEQYQMNVV